MTDLIRFLTDLKAEHQAAIEPHLREIVKIDAGIKELQKIESQVMGLDSQRGETAMKGSSSQQVASHQGSASAPDGLRADQLAKLPWRTNKRGLWAFADEPEFKELAAKIGTGRNDSFTDEKGFVHTITVGENGKKFINRSKSK